MKKLETERKRLEAERRRLEKKTEMEQKKQRRDRSNQRTSKQSKTKRVKERRALDDGDNDPVFVETERVFEENGNGIEEPEGVERERRKRRAPSSSGDFFYF